MWPDVVQALQHMKVMPGTEELAELLDELGIPRALITRNVEMSVQHFHARVFKPRPFAPALARSFTPYKPAPEALLHVCKQWGIPSAHAVMVGDSPKDDIVCGNRAGAQTILIDFERKFAVGQLPAEQQPTFHVTSMQEVADILQQKCDLIPPSAEQMPLQMN